MRGTLVPITPPATEPVTLAEVRDFLRLGASTAEPAPAAPTAALATPAAAGNVDNGAHRYRITFVTAGGETDGGTVSSIVTVADKAVNGKVALSAIPLGGSAVTSRKLYRTVAGGSTYLLLVTLADNTTTTYTDNIADASLGAGCPTVNGTEDPLLIALLEAARGEIDGGRGWLGRALITQTWDLVLDEFPAVTRNNPYAAIKVPLPPLQSVTSVTYLDDNGVSQTLSASLYDVDIKSEPGQVRPAYGESWPTTRDTPQAVTVRFVAGYGAAAAVPALIKLWLRIRLSTLYEHREQFVTGTIVSSLPGMDAMLDSLRIYGEE
jgi:uncharacterized phiE125 gp8 family phage protein